MLLFIAGGVGLFAVLSLIAAIIYGSVVFGWITVVASASGLLMIFFNEVRERAARDEQHLGVSPPPSPPEKAVVAPTEEQPSVASEAADDDAMLRPEIWPPGHPVHQRQSEGDRVKPQEDELRPEIWP